MGEEERFAAAYRELRDAIERWMEREDAGRIDRRDSGALLLDEANHIDAKLRGEPRENLAYNDAKARQEFNASTPEEREALAEGMTDEQRARWVE